MQQTKTTLVQLPLTTLGQETRCAYSTTLPSPHGAGKGGSHLCAGKIVLHLLSCIISNSAVVREMCAAAIVK